MTGTVTRLALVHLLSAPAALCMSRLVALQSFFDAPRSFGENSRIKCLVDGTASSSGMLITAWLMRIKHLKGITLRDTVRAVISVTLCSHRSFPHGPLPTSGVFVSDEGRLTYITRFTGKEKLKAAHSPHCSLSECHPRLSRVLIPWTTIGISIWRNLEEREEYIGVSCESQIKSWSSMHAVAVSAHYRLPRNALCIRPGVVLEAVGGRDAHVEHVNHTGQYGRQELAAEMNEAGTKQW
ncbi:predicted protein [Postia placenta Mad-698-R]|nr:predicted protein [Postia placenta Mad-698-R]